MKYLWQENKKQHKLQMHFQYFSLSEHQKRRTKEWMNDFPNDRIITQTRIYRFSLELLMFSW